MLIWRSLLRRSFNNGSQVPGKNMICLHQPARSRTLEVATSPLEVAVPWKGRNLGRDHTTTVLCGNCHCIGEATQLIGALYASCGRKTCTKKLPYDGLDYILSRSGGTPTEACTPTCLELKSAKNDGPMSHNNRV